MKTTDVLLCDDIEQVDVPNDPSNLIIVARGGNKP